MKLIIECDINKIEDIQKLKLLSESLLVLQNGGEKVNLDTFTEEIKFEGDTAIIPPTVKEKIERSFKGLCTFPEGCDRRIMSRGLCRMHYQRARKLRLTQ